MHTLSPITHHMRPLRLSCCVAAACLHAWLASAALAANDTALPHSALQKGAISFSIAMAPVTAPPEITLPESAPSKIAPAPAVSESSASNVPQQRAASNTRVAKTPAAEPPSAPLAQSVAREQPVAAQASPEPSRQAAHGVHELVELREPQFLSPPQPPRYPTVARKRGQQGTVWVGVQLDEQGQQAKRHVLMSSGLAVLDNAALLAVSRWQFRPYEVSGVGRPSRVRIPIEFSLN